MRLLDKKLVQASQAQERKIEIDKGIKLTRAIEALRETKVQEEQALERFREETMRKVQTEIDTLIRERDTLRKEITTLQALQNDYGRS